MIFFEQLKRTQVIRIKFTMLSTDNVDNKLVNTVRELNFKLYLSMSYDLLVQYCY